MTSITEAPPTRLGQELTGRETVDRALCMRIAMAIAILSVAVHSVHDTAANFHLGRWHMVAAAAVIFAAAPLALYEKTSRLAIAAFGLAMLLYVAVKWSGYHNHGWLAVWTIPVAAFFGTRWWEDETYQWYLRMTLGVVMLGACAQKLVAGTYLNGTFIAYLSLHGAETEQAFGFLCNDLSQGPCTAHKVLGTFLVVWQAAVGLLLLAGVRNLAFLVIEVAFLLGAGLYADEMNFQVLNITLFCIAFGYGIPMRLVAVLVFFLTLDVIDISRMVAYVL